MLSWLTNLLSKKNKCILADNLQNESVDLIDDNVTIDEEDAEFGNETKKDFRLTPFICWVPKETVLNYREPLTELHLNAVVKDYKQRKVEGNLIYSPPIGTILPGGFQDLNVTFIPLNYQKYKSAIGYAEVNIKRVKPFIAWSDCIEPIPYGSRLTQEHFDGIQNELKGGQYIFSHNINDRLEIGNHRITVQFIPELNDQENYSYGYAARQLTVVGAEVDLKWEIASILPSINYPSKVPSSFYCASCLDTDIEGEFLYNPARSVILPVGSHKITATFIPNDKTRYKPSTVSQYVTIQKGTIRLTWSKPAPIRLGDELDSSNLNCYNELNIPGNYVYEPLYGTVLPSLGKFDLKVQFVPDDSFNWNDAYLTSEIKVLNKIIPLLYWSTPEDIIYPEPLSKAQLNASISGVPIKGTMKYLPDFETVLTVGEHVLSAEFIPSKNSVQSAEVTTTLRVLQGQSKIVWNEPDWILEGEGLFDNILNARCTNLSGGSFRYNPSRGFVLLPGQHKLHVVYTPDDQLNYENAETTVKITVRERPKLQPVLVWERPVVPYALKYPTPLNHEHLNAVCTNVYEGIMTYTPPLNTILPVGRHILKALFTPANLQFCIIASIESYITIQVGAPEITWYPLYSSLTYGTVLQSGIHLNAQCQKCEGNFQYEPSHGKIPSCGALIVKCTFTPNDSHNYLSTEKTAIFSIQYAVPEIDWDEPIQPFKYPLIISESLLNPRLKSTFDGCTGKFKFSLPVGTILDVGEHTLSCRFYPDDITNFHCGNASIKVNVMKSEPHIAWFPETSILYETPLDIVNHLNAKVFSENPNQKVKVGVEMIKSKEEQAVLDYLLAKGIFDYHPSNGYIPDATDRLKLTLKYTPCNSKKFHETEEERFIQVQKRVIIINWDPPSVLQYSQPLDEHFLCAQISSHENTPMTIKAMKNYPGEFIYDPPLGTILNVKDRQQLRLHFRPHEKLRKNYSEVKRVVTISIVKIKPEMRWKPAATQMIEGNVLTNAHLCASVVKSNIFKGEVKYSHQLGTVLPVGRHKIQAEFIPDNLDNASPVSAIVTFEVIKVKKFHA